MFVNKTNNRSPRIMQKVIGKIYLNRTRIYQEKRVGILKLSSFKSNSIETTFLRKVGE